MQDQEGIQTCMPDKMAFWAAVVAQLAQMLLPIPGVHCSNQVIRNIFQINIFTVKCYKDENKEKEAENGTWACSCSDGGLVVSV